MATPMALNNVQFLVPVDGGVSKLQAILPTAAWYSIRPASVVADLIGSCLLVSRLGGFSITSLLNVFFCVFLVLYRNTEQKRILWKIPDISQKSENGGTSLEYGFIVLTFSNK